MKKVKTNHAIYRKDYSQPTFWVDHVELEFDVDFSSTQVRSVLTLRRNAALDKADIVLDGVDLETEHVMLDGCVLSSDDYTLGERQLVIKNAPPACTVETLVRIQPDQNTALEGLYQSNQFLLTQCEAEGFRKITWFPDRPDIMASYQVKVSADRQQFPVLLSNGNRLTGGNLPEGRHFVIWQDPFPKPSYLFALVAGDLQCISDHWTTAAGRKVDLNIYVEAENLDKCDYAMDCLKRSMAWDEQRYGLEYDLDIYNIVATNDFNMGAMENKGLNIFNSKYVLARPDTATDADYQAIEGVIGHEYFHNWTGNRVTCRDWFQLTLKEGLTVYRDQEFSRDMQSPAVKRIQDVVDLRSRQFPEDSGPMAHPIRPDKYIEINNFYTATVYEKGAQVIRMYETMLGRDGFREGMDLYFQRHDGQAVTCDDFLAAMADANQRDLSVFSRWYSRPGTPIVTVSDDYEPATQRYTLTLQQSRPTDAQQDPLLIPVAVGLLGQNGQALPVTAGRDDAGTRVLEFSQWQQSFVFEEVSEHPVPSLLRDFSAPVVIRYAYSKPQLSLLARNDTDPFARWEAAQKLFTEVILELAETDTRPDDWTLNSSVTEVCQAILEWSDEDPGLAAELLALPSVIHLAEQMSIVDLDGIHQAREWVASRVAQILVGQLSAVYQRSGSGSESYQNTPAATGRRALRNRCLRYLTRTQDGAALALQQYTNSSNMTDTLAALRALLEQHPESAGPVLAAFEQKWRQDALVMDKWFSLQARRRSPDTLEDVIQLMTHPAFSIKNPNKVRALIKSFASADSLGFHRSDGAGYRFVADQVINLNRINPQIAARLVAAFNQWRRYTPDRQQLMLAELERIAAVQDLSADVYEIVSAALKDKADAA